MMETSSCSAVTLESSKITSIAPAPAPLATVKLQGLQGGGGEDSYATNSMTQNYLFHRYGKPHLSQALDHVFSTFYCSNSLDEMRHRPLCVVDLGCSHGPNTLEYAHFIVQGMQERLQQGMLSHTQSAAIIPSLNEHHASIPGGGTTANFEIQYVFSDLPGNDFNALFRSLCPLGPLLQNALLVSNGENNHKSNGSAVCYPPQMNIFAAGVPGSFYGRLFPKESLHLAVSGFSLHWLSQVPPSVVDKTGPAWNGGQVWIHGERPKVVEAYAQQFQKDARAFLESRAQELVRGGILFIFAITRSQEHPSGYFLDLKDGADFWMGDFQSTWQQMVHEGLITEEEMDMFNVPHYNFHRRELEAALESLEGELEVIKMEVLKDSEILPNAIIEKLEKNPEAFGKAWASIIASLVKPLVQAHLSEYRTEELFKRLEHMATKRMYSMARSKATPGFDVIIAIIQRR